MSASLFPVHGKLLQPSAVEVSAVCRFLNGNEAPQLVTAHANVLRVYRLQQPQQYQPQYQQHQQRKQQDIFDDQRATRSCDDQTSLLFPDANDTLDGQLSLVGEYRLNGRVVDIAVLPSPVDTNKADMLFLSFCDAKASIVAFCAEEHDIQTVSMHYYEHETYKSLYLSQSTWPQLRADPTGRCVVMRVYQDRLAVVPLRQTEDHDDESIEKPPYLSSFLIKWRDIDDRMRHITDFDFLPGYFAPTMAVLFRQHQTTTGLWKRAPYFASLAILSFDLVQRVAPPIYTSFDNVPSDAFAIVAVPKPIGGVVVVASNSIIYYNQGTSPVGVAVNAYAYHARPPSLKLHDHRLLQLSLDGSRFVFIAPDQMLLSLREGDMYIVSLVKEGRNVSKLKLKKVGLCVPASSMVVLSGKYVFIGSRCADSVLLRFQQVYDTAHAPVKRLKVEDSHHELDDEIFGSSNNSASAAPTTHVIKSEPKPVLIPGSFHFKVHAILPNLSPMVSMTVGFSPISTRANPVPYHDTTEPYSETTDPLELAVCCGKGEFSKWVILQQSIRPIIQSSFELPDSPIGLWSVRCSSTDSTNSTTTTSELKVDEEFSKRNHKFLVISKKFENSDRHYSMVLSSGSTLQEISRSDFFTSGATVTVSSLFDNTRVCQIYPSGIRLLDISGKLCQEIFLQDETETGEQRWVVMGSICDPYVSVKMSDGKIVLLKGDASKKELQVLDAGEEVDDITASVVCLYRDTTGMLSLVEEQLEQDGKLAVPEIKQEETSSKRKAEDSIEASSRDMDGLDDEIFGATEEKPKIVTPTEVKQQHFESIQPKEPTNWLSVLKKNGTFEIYALPTMTLVFSVQQLNQLSSVLSDSVASSNLVPQNSFSKIFGDINDILLTEMGSAHNSRPVLVVHTLTGDVALYEAFRYVPPKNEDSKSRLAIRFRRLRLDYIARYPEETADTAPSNTKNAMPSPPRETKSEHSLQTISPSKRFLIPFDNIQGYADRTGTTFFKGVFVAGKRAAWIVIGNSGHVRTHPMSVDGGIYYFSQFDNANCSKGFIYFNEHGTLRLCSLPTNMEYDAEWPLRQGFLRDNVFKPPPKEEDEKPADLKVEAQTDVKDVKQESSEESENLIINHVRSPYKILCHSVSKQYTCLTYVPAKFILPKEEIDETDEPRRDQPPPQVSDEPDELEPGKFRPISKQFYLELVSPLNLASVDRYEFLPDEQAMCIAECSVEVKISGIAKRRDFIVVGTANLKGEDTQCRGKLRIFDVIEVVPEPGRPETNHKLKLVKMEDIKGPVTAVSAVAGQLLLTMGPKLMIYSFEDGERLVGTSFLDTNLYITSLQVIKNYIFLGDIRKSLWFIAYNEDPSKLILLGKDYNFGTTVDGNFLIDENSLQLLVGDRENNLIMLSYAPTHMGSFSGQKMLRGSDFHVGSPIARILRLAKKKKDTLRHLCIYNTLDGSIGYVMPVSERTFKRFNDIYNELVNRVEHRAGLNPRAYRLFRSHDVICQPSRNVIDGEFIAQTYPNLSTVDQIKWARNKGTTSDRVLNDLADLSLDSELF